MNQLSERRRVVRTLLFLIVIVIVALITVVAVATALQTDSSFDPVTYGLPDTIAGYRVLAVRTSENTACMLPGARQVILQTTEASEDEFLLNSRPDAIQQELSQFGTVGAGNWEVAIVGPGATLEQIVSGAGEWNSQFENGECLKLGPIEVSLTSS